MISFPERSLKKQRYLCLYSVYCLILATQAEIPKARKKKVKDLKLLSFGEDEEVEDTDGQQRFSSLAYTVMFSSCSEENEECA